MRPELEFHSLLVLRDGRPVREQYWAPYVEADRTLMYSASKTFTASAIALAIAEGHLALTDWIVELLPQEWAAVAEQDAAVARLTVHHVLSMSTGHDVDTMDELEAAAPADWARTFLSTPPQTPVGSRHVYNNGASWLLGELIRQRTGEDLLDYLRPRLLEPLGIDATWDRDALGRCFGWTGIHVRTRDLAAMGELYRCDGVWQGRRLLPQGWVARATRAQIPTEEPEPDWCFGYGYQLWLGREGYRFDGAYGQFSLVLPERGLVIAITSAQSATQLLLDLVWEILIPELDGEPKSLVEPVETTELGTLALPTDSGIGENWSTTGTAQVDESLVDSPDPQSSLPNLTGLSAHREGTRFQVAFTTEGGLVELTAGNGEWVRQQVPVGDAVVPVASAAGSDASGALDIRLVFTDSPHTLHLRIAGDTAGMAWGTTPLQGGYLSGLVAR